MKKSFIVSFLIITAAHFGAPWTLLPTECRRTPPPPPAGSAAADGVQF
jgi:hypothetical protein